MSVKRTISALFVGAAALFSVVVLPGQAAASPERVAAPQSCAAVGTGWAKTNSAIGTYDSPWMESAMGVYVKREIQFRANSGAMAVRCVNGQAQGAPVTFFYASQYRVRSCSTRGPLACQTSGLLSYTERNRGPLAEYRFPGQAVGWDPFYNVFRTWVF